jgi:hypothetical protein
VPPPNGLFLTNTFRLAAQLSKANFLELDQGEVRAEGRAGKARNWSERGNRTAGYSSSTNSSRGTPYALAIFVTVGM